MTAARTVTIETLDRGRITIPEPSWCTGHEGHPPQYRADTIHSGPALLPAFSGYELTYAAIAQAPYADRVSRDVHASVSLGEFNRACSPAELDSLAAVLVEHAAQLRAMARTLAVLLARGEGQ
ncbi:DUF6907 domain-containing protein [Streptomyces odonnellii]|uniref:DUF6907 domain-containing protein n=1 Tax=Streptomyces odonnellii TaxID=1417980 RepID=UPI000626AFC6|nr:hypothetical protein [Streptomyces odonnellii]